MPPQQRKTTGRPRVPATRAPKAPKSQPIEGFFLPQDVCQEAVTVISELIKNHPEPLSAAIGSGADVVARKLLSLQPVKL